MSTFKLGLPLTKTEAGLLLCTSAVIMYNPTADKDQRLIFKRLYDHLAAQFRKKELEFLLPLLEVLRDTLGNPSIERGMLQGGIEGFKDLLIEKISDFRNKNGYPNEETEI
jgi:hypothetical protein